VCGGGIYGAWTAYDAALRGLKVLIVDQGDWACGTSSASSKLIHGGLRYLENLDFAVVKKSLKERQRLIDMAPYRVWPLRFGVPVNKYSQVGSLRLKAGLFIYDLLAGTLYSRKSHLQFNKQQFAQRFPCLDSTLASSGFTYLDAQTDDARLVFEIISGAENAGAVCINHCKINTIENYNTIYRANLHDQISGKSYSVKTSSMVKTTGQWTAVADPEKQWCRLSKGVHLVLPKILENEALLLTAKSDGRVFFIIPWYGMTLLGTTDTDFNADINRVVVDQQDRDYLLTEANHALATNWTAADIQGEFAGLRVLQHSSESTPYKISRDWELKLNQAGIFHSIGGKLTSSREDAETIVDAVCKHLGNDIACQTGEKPFPWMPAGNFLQWSERMTNRARQLGIDSESTLWLLRRHGKNVTKILSNIEQNKQLARRITPNVPLIVADLMFCLDHEMVFHLEDLLRRRMPLLILYRMTKVELIQFAELCAKALDWDQASVENEIENCSQKWLLH
jgi:glycerol-3-phosphate dehydrogenase